MLFYLLPLFPLSLFSVLFLWWGRSLTSPINHVRYAWRFGAQLAGKSNKTTQQNFLKTGYAFFFALCSVISTSLSIIFFLPLLLQTLAPIIFPQLILNLSPMVLSAFNLLGSFILYYQPPLLAALIIEPVWVGISVCALVLLGLFEPIETHFLKPCRDYYFEVVDEKYPISKEIYTSNSTSNSEREETDLSQWPQQKVKVLPTHGKDPRLFSTTWAPRPEETVQSFQLTERPH
jgi:hypothetical protein